MEKTDRNGIYRVEDGVLVNLNYDELYSYRKQREAMKRQKELEHDVEILKNDMAEIKSLLKELTNK